MAWKQPSIRGCGPLNVNKQKHERVRVACGAKMGMARFPNCHRATRDKGHEGQGKDLPENSC